MKDIETGIVRLSEYRPPSHRITDVSLHVDIHDGATVVRSKLSVVAVAAETTLRLDGEQLDLVAVAVNGRELLGNEYRRDDMSLTLFDVPTTAEIAITTRIRPESNTALSGLYRSGRMYCTQCEPEGFRRITYYLDRPDVLARFTTTIVADASRCPVLLANGNLIASGPEADGRHRAVWEDPFPKPAYLFALVAGDLALLTDTFVTRSGRSIELRIYSEPHNIDQCGFAMEALKRAMRWDEDVYGLEYDLDLFMIVAVEDFNMGAMENKGLNIFNTSCVLVSKDTATDAAYRRVEAVVAHEYFHNWSGNRVTCRDWFQLSLKEGFTVFRDSKFSGDMHSAMVKRIEDVEFLRTYQFPEDAGPLAHPVRPDAYMEISNFYTTTVYEKGAEVVRMIHTLLGPERFRRGTDLYFSRHDGQAVTTEDFVVAMEDATGIDLRQFRRWYEQAGTPVVTVARQYADGVLRLTIDQHCPATPGQPEKAPFHIPLAIGLLRWDAGELLGAAGESRGGSVQVDCDAEVDNPKGDGTLVVHLRTARTRLEVSGLGEAPVVSVLRGFSAPVRLVFERDAGELAFLALHDTDGFSRWDAMRSLQLDAVEQIRRGDEAPGALTAIYGRLLERAAAADCGAEEQALLAEMLQLPTETYLGEQLAEIDVDGVHAGRAALKTQLARSHVNAFEHLYALHAQPSYAPTATGMARRSLRNLALSYLCAAGTDAGASAVSLQSRLLDHLTAADNLTDRLAGLREVLEAEWLSDAERARVVDDFYARWRTEKLVIDQWFSFQAMASRPGALDRVLALESHPAFDRRNPNRVRALYGAFCTQNLINFHRSDGSGYRFLAERVIAIDASNPQLAARLLSPMTRFRRYDARRQKMMAAALLQIRDSGARSTDVRELVVKSLG